MKLPAEILKDIATSISLGFNYGEGWLQSWDSTHSTMPAVFMFPITETGNDTDINENFINLDLAFSVLKIIDVNDFSGTDFAVNMAHVTAMKAECLRFLRKIRDYKNTAGVPIFSTSNLSSRKIQDIVKISMFDNYVSGVYCEIQIKMLNTESIC